MFNNSSNAEIHDGHFQVIENLIQLYGPKFSGSSERTIDILLKASALGAVHDSEQRFDPPKCHPNTRVAVLNNIMDWVVGKAGWERTVMWLYGPAGCGKSAIAQTIAEWCYEQKRLLGSFFFSRSDLNRNNAKPLAPTLAYQLLLNLPRTRPFIEGALEKNPAVDSFSLESQFKQLFVEPLSRLCQAGVLQDSYPNVIIIDGLDECLDPKSQSNIVDVITRSLRSLPFPFLLLIASRAEPHLSISFSAQSMNSIVRRLSLDDDYRATKDIQRYLRDSFDEIKRIHPLRSQIPTDWPDKEDEKKIAAKSSGQFIYAATVIRYISSIRHRPTNRLNVILGISPSHNDAPFAQLDNLYREILSSAQDLPSALKILRVLIVPQPYKRFIYPEFGIEGRSEPEFLERLLYLEVGDVEHILLDLGSIIQYRGPTNPIRMYHASFGDFLLDQTRSQECYLERPSLHTDFAMICLRHIQMSGQSDDTSDVSQYAYRSVSEHCSKANPTAELRQLILETPVGHHIFNHQLPSPEIFIDFLAFLRSSGFFRSADLQIYHLGLWENVLRSRLDRSPSDSFLAAYILRTDPTFQDTLEDIFFAVFSSVFDDLTWNILGPPHLLIDCVTDPRLSTYRNMLFAFFTDPSRAGRYSLDRKKIVDVATLLTKYISCSDELEKVARSPATTLSAMTWLRTLLANCEYSKELTQRIKNIHLWRICQRYPEAVRLMESAISDYLLRVGVPTLGMTISFARAPNPVTSEAANEWIWDSVTGGWKLMGSRYIL